MAVFLLAAAALCGFSAGADAQTTLISNWSLQTSGSIGSQDYDIAQPFTTGTAGGYELSTIELDWAAFGQVEDGNDIAASLWTATSSNDPDTELFELSTSSVFTFEAPGRKTFSAPSNSRLDPRTTYVVKLVRTAGTGNAGAFRLIENTTLADSTQEGWDISRARIRNKPDGNWTNGSRAKPLKIRIKGTVFPAPETPTNLTAQAVAPTRIHLDWEGSIPSPKDLDREDPPGYRIEWSADGNAPWNQEGEFGIWCACYGTQFNDNTIAPGTTRYYRIQAVDKDDRISDYSTVVSATTPGLVDSGNEQIEFGVVASELDALDDQKVFRIQLEAGEKYRFTIRGEASKHRVVVTTGGMEIENFVLESNNNLVPRITAQRSGEHQVKISHGGSLGNAGSLNAGWFHFALVPVREELGACSASWRQAD